MALHNATLYCYVVWVWLAASQRTESREFYGSGTLAFLVRPSLMNS